MIILQAKDITKSFGIETIFENISFIINEGEKVGLVGSNGAGKTTLFRCLTGEEQADCGEITIANKYTMGYLEQIPQNKPGTTLMDCVLDSFVDILTCGRACTNWKRKWLQSQGGTERLLERYSLLTHKYEE